MFDFFVIKIAFIKLHNYDFTKYGYFLFFFSPYYILVREVRIICNDFFLQATKDGESPKHIYVCTIIFENSYPSSARKLNIKSKGNIQGLSSSHYLLSVVMTFSGTLCPGSLLKALNDITFISKITNFDNIFIFKGNNEIYIPILSHIQNWTQ